MLQQYFSRAARVEQGQVANTGQFNVFGGWQALVILRHDVVVMWCAD